VQSYDDPVAAQREEVGRGVDIISSGGKRRAMQAMILQATPRRSGGRGPDWPAVDKLAAEYANIDVPTAIVCGAHDETLPSSMSYKLRAQIRGATLRVFPDCKHSPHLEHPQQCADALTCCSSGLLRRLFRRNPALTFLESARLPQLNVHLRRWHVFASGKPQSP
jgi:alpha-beta hydrolase superfamily lysophospholipase